MWFSFRNVTYQNNSNVTLEDIGENDTALLCMTNLTTCCRSENGLSLGNWAFPNGTQLPCEIVYNTSPEWEFYKDRGHMVVRMHRRRGGVEGIYSCDIPDSMNVTQTIYIGVYKASTGEI